MKTHTPFYPALTRYTLPLMATALFLSLAPLAEVWLAGMFLGERAAAGVGTAEQLHYLFRNAGVGLASGGTLLISRLKGEGKRTLTGEVRALLLLTALYGGGAGALLTLLAHPLLTLLATPAAAMEGALITLRISAAALPCFCLFQSASAVLNALGDSLRTLWLTLGYALTRAVAAAVSLTIFHTYIAFATSGLLISAIWVPVSVLTLFLAHRDVLPFKAEDTASGTTAQLARLGIPLALLNAAATLSFLGVTRLIHRAGEAAGNAIALSGAYALAIRLNNFVLLPLRAVTTGISAFTARAIGDERYELVRPLRLAGLRLGYTVAIPAFLAVLAGADILLTVLGGDHIAAAGAAFFRLSAFDFMVTPLLGAAYGTTDGRGKTGISMWINALTSLFVRMPLAAIALSLGWGLTGVGAALPLTTLSAVIAVYLSQSARLFPRAVMPPTRT